MPISRCRCLIEIQSTIHKILLENQILVIEWCHTNELFILVFERTSNKQTFVMVSISIIAFLTSIWTDFIFAPTYFKLLPCLNFGSDFLLLAKILNQQPWALTCIILVWSPWPISIPPCVRRTDPSVYTWTNAPAKKHRLYPH